MHLISITLNLSDGYQGKQWTLDISPESIWASKEVIPVEAAKLAKDIAGRVGWQPCICQPQGSEDEPCEACSCARR